MLMFNKEHIKIVQLILKTCILFIFFIIFFFCIFPISKFLKIEIQFLIILNIFADICGRANCKCKAGKHQPPSEQSFPKCAHFELGHRRQQSVDYQQQHESGIFQCVADAAWILMMNKWEAGKNSNYDRI